MEIRHDLNLTTRLEQRQVMTPIMQQALKVLQASTLELLEIINQELQENPALDVEKPSEIDESLEQKIEELEKLISSTEKYDDRSYFPNQEDALEKYEYMINSVTYMESLHDHLDWQVRLVLSDEEDLKIAEYIIYNIDDDGFLQVTVEEIARYFNTSPERVSTILKEIQELEPVGVGARDVREALLIQLRYNGLEDSWAYRIVENYYDDFIKNKLSKIARAIGISLEAVKEAKEIISKLNPYPGRQYKLNAQPRYVIPDATVDKEDGQLIITINDKIIPRLRISPVIKRIVENPRNVSREDLRYITEKIQNANYIIKSIQERQNTLYKVVESIFTVQMDFLDKGIKYLKPLTLSEIAEMVGHHESTISRITNNKFVATPRGVYELKYFFSSKITGINKEDLSSKSIKEIIKDLIEKEDKTHPLTDEEIRKQLEGMGYKISRRTVTKFREQMNILPSYKRKQW